MSRTVAATVTALLAAVASTARATPDTLCLPDTAPNEPAWWNPGLSAVKKEARWAGALVRKVSEGGHAARVRALWSPGSELVYVEYRVAGDIGLNAAEDSVVIALGDAAGTAPELLIRFSPVAGCANVAACAGAGAPLDVAAVQFAEATSGPTSLTWSDLSPTTPTGDFAVEHPWVVVEDNGGVLTWTLSFALHVPVDASGDIRPDLRIYGNALAYDPGVTSGTYYEHPALCTSSSVVSNDCLLAPWFELPGSLPVGNLVSSWSVLRSDCPALAIP